MSIIESKERSSTSDSSNEIKLNFSQFLAGVSKLEELASFGGRLVTGFKQALNFLNRPSISETSELVQAILKANETSRVKRYVQAGCVNTHDEAQNLTQLETCLSGLQNHVSKAKEVIDELECLKDRVGTLVQDALEDAEIEVISDTKETDCAFLMAMICSMVKQDFEMQEKIVSSLSLKSSMGELDTYSLMWSLRPFVNDELINEALRYAT